LLLKAIAALADPIVALIAVSLAGSQLRSVIPGRRQDCQNRMANVAGWR
jgi:hypothetical protein